MWEVAFVSCNDEVESGKFCGFRLHCVLEVGHPGFQSGCQNGLVYAENSEIGVGQQILGTGKRQVSASVFFDVIKNVDNNRCRDETMKTVVI